MQFYVDDWITDPALSMCSPTTRGIWIDLLCAMHRSGRAGEIVGTDDQIARLCRCSAEEARAAIAELEQTGAADVSHDVSHDCRHGVAIRNRRMYAEANHRQGKTLQKRAERTGGDVAGLSPSDGGGCRCDVATHKPEARGQKPETTGLPPTPKFDPEIPESRTGAGAPDSFDENETGIGHHADLNGFSAESLALLARTYPELAARGVDLEKLASKALGMNGERFAFVTAVIGKCDDPTAKDPIACGVHRIKQGDHKQKNWRRDIERRVRSILDPVPADRICPRCAVKLTDRTSAGSGRRDAICPTCSRAWAF
jgi:uncharacterized protein YdaU (DUF1376 family)